jgi:hypothetical protein
MDFSSLADVRSAVSRGDRGLTETGWSAIAEAGWADDVLEGNMTLDELVEKSIEMREGAPVEWGGVLGEARRQPEGNRVEALRWDRVECLSEALWADANRLPSVENFRRDVLDGQVLPLSEVVEWVERVNDSEGPPTAYATIALDDDGEPLRDSAGQLIQLSTEVKKLSYAGPTERFARGRFTRRGGDLDRLRLLAERLSAAYPWTQAQAVAFVLTNEVPRINDIRVTTPSGHAPVVDGVFHKWMERIILEVDPALPPAFVEKVYRETRDGMGDVRRRTMAPRQMYLAAFAEQEDQAIGWPELRRKWNDRYPKWLYPDASNFRRHVREAQNRLLYGEVLVKPSE